MPAQAASAQLSPFILGEMISKLARYPVITIAVLMILLAVTGMRISEMLGLEIDANPKS